MSSESRQLLAQLRRQIDRHFSLDEIELICFDLNIDYEHLAGAAKPKKIHNLLLLVVRNSLLPDLLTLLHEERVGVEWPALPTGFDPLPNSSPAPDLAAGNQFQVGDVASGSTVVGNIGEGATVVGAGATVVGAGGSLNVQNYQISGAITGDVNIAGDVHISSEELPIPAPPAEEAVPSIDGFVGRESELAHFSNTLQLAHLAVISGMAGMGKTALAVTLAQQVAPAKKIFWHSIRQGEGIEVIVWQLAAFLARREQEELWQLLQRSRLTRGNLPPTEVLLDYVIQLLQGGEYLLCLDDLHLVDSDPQMQLSIERARTAVTAGSFSLIITSRRLPEYVTLVDTAFISGLTVEATKQLLHNRGVQLSAELVTKMHSRTHGNAELLTLSIEMLRQTRNPARLLDNLAEAQDVERILLSEIDAHLSELEPEVMSAVSVLNLFGHMGTRYAIAEILEGQNVRRVLRDLSDRFLLIERRIKEGGEYGQHALVQAFYYDSLNRRQRQAMHRLAARYYQNEEPQPLQAALHVSHAGKVQTAIRLVSDNLWELLNAGHSPALVALLQHILTQELEPAEQVQTKVAQGEVYAFLGESEEAQACYQEVLSQLAAQRDTDAVRAQRVRELGVWLSSPAGMRVRLFDSVGGDGFAFETRSDDMNNGLVGDPLADFVLDDSSVFHFSDFSWYCSSPNMTIPDNNSVGVSDHIGPLTVPGPLLDLNVTFFAPHTWVGDLVFNLEHNDTAKSVDLIHRPGISITNPAGSGCPENDINAFIDDEAFSEAENMCAVAPARAIEGKLIGGDPPNSSLLATFDGDKLTGTWTLTASDHALGDTGSVVQWCLGATTTQGDPATVVAAPLVNTAVHPAENLSSFIGERAVGTWTLEICDRSNTVQGWLGSWFLEIQTFNGPLAASGGPYTVGEGSSISLIPATFTDPGTLDTHTATIDWGDGTLVSGSVGAGTVSGSHAYVEDGAYTVEVCVTDDDGDAGCDSFTATISNVAPTLSGVTISAAVAENETATLSGTISAPGTQDSFALEVDWGDGVVETFPYAAGTATFSEIHRYLDDPPSGTHQVLLTLTDDDVSADSGFATIAVQNVAPSVNAGADQSARPGKLVNFSGSFTDPGTLDTRTTSWDFGDGGGSAGTLQQTHVYSVPGHYTLILTVTDDDGGEDTDEALITVTPYFAFIPTIRH